MNNQFFLKFESAQGQFTPTYRVLSETTEAEAVNVFNAALNPFRVASGDAELIITLYEAGESMGKESMVSALPVILTGPIPWGHEGNTHSHPQDYTVYHNSIPDEMLQELEALAVWEHHSFPNGSNYSQQNLPRGKFTLPSFGVVEIDYGYYIRHGWDVYQVSNARRSVGAGVNLGAHFNNRDQALVAFMKRK